MVLSTLLQNLVVLFPISEPHGPLFTSPKLPDPGLLPFPSEPRGTLLFYFRTTWTPISIYLLQNLVGLLFPSEPHGLLLSPPKPCGPLHSPSEPRGPFPHFRTTWASIYLLASEPRGSPIYFRAAWSTPSFRTAWSPPHLLWSRMVSSTLQSRMVSSTLPQNLVVLPPSMAAAPRFKSQRPSSFAAPFPTPPTVSYTCQHPCILPALTGLP